jgi:hypothetical protein
MYVNIIDQNKNIYMMFHQTLFEYVFETILNVHYYLLMNI